MIDWFTCVYYNHVFMNSSQCTCSMWVVHVHVYGEGKMGSVII